MDSHGLALLALVGAGQHRDHGNSKRRGLRRGCGERGRRPGPRGGPIGDRVGGLQWLLVLQP